MQAQLQICTFSCPDPLPYGEYKPAPQCIEHRRKRKFAVFPIERKGIYSAFHWRESHPSTAFRKSVRCGRTSALDMECRLVTDFGKRIASLLYARPRRCDRVRSPEKSSVAYYTKRRLQTWRKRLAGCIPEFNRRRYDILGIWPSRSWKRKNARRIHSFRQTHFCTSEKPRCRDSKNRRGGTLRPRHRKNHGRICDCTPQSRS